MLLTLIIIISLIGAAVIGNIYSNFLVFYSNFGETESYNKAYYAAISALERAELVIKQRQPGFEGTGGRIGATNQGYSSDGPIANGFSYLSRDSGKDTTSTWNIQSLTNRVPKLGKGDVNRTLSTGDSVNYNMMDYNNSEIFLLYKDPGSSNPYTKLLKQNMIKSSMNSVSGSIRLPGYLRNTFGNLNVNSGLVLPNDPNDAIVDRQVMGNYNGNQFTVFATQNINTHGDTELDDSAIRERNLNNGYNFNFKNSKHPNGGTTNKWTIISPNQASINNFQQIFNNNAFSGNQIRFSLLNKLKNTAGDIYPFLEYYITFGNSVPDKYYTVNAKGNYGDYLVNLTIQKTTIQESILQSFTTIF